MRDLQGKRGSQSLRVRDPRRMHYVQQAGRGRESVQRLLRQRTQPASMKPEIRDPSVSPPEKRWVFFVKETSYEVSVSAYANLKNAITRHCLANGVPVPTEDEITKYLCDSLTIDCRQNGKPYPNRFASQEDFTPPDMRPVPRDRWPLWAKGLALVSTDADIGIGDTVRRLIGDFASDAFKAWHKATFGRSCDCSARQAKWNAQYPLR